MQERRYYKILTNKTNSQTSTLATGNNLKPRRSLQKPGLRCGWWEQQCLSCEWQSRGCWRGVLAISRLPNCSCSEQLMHFLASRIGSHKTKGVSSRQNTKLSVKTPLQFNPSFEVAFLKSNSHVTKLVGFVVSISSATSELLSAGHGAAERQNGILKGTRKRRDTHPSLSAFHDPEIL